ncbi:TonB-dependent receptor [Sphingobium cloacae]|uniref:TonB-dependent receptor-like protein n=1 Tax=Sphingobium cloacae TaxID=120107 RepID=A0A1E1F4Y4_9SPHN|nr:TonB-dependent receptor [Sphingobium cloacae]BAV65579.1 TonB-dependent receptor-like protein [Sphingobium cloacae]
MVRWVSGPSLAALAFASFGTTAAYAQSTGSIDFDKEIVVTAAGNESAQVGGVAVPNTSKAKAVLTQEFIARQTPGQSVNDVINQLPGVSFQNNDPYGSGGGTLTIRGFDDTRISQTVDGIPLNDTGNYALYTNQQVDPELIDQVNVNLGTTDIDSPTASASGSTVNYRTLVPTEDFGARLAGTYGDFSYFRLFGLVNTGILTPAGTRAWLSASRATYDSPFGHFGKVEKTQFNAKLYQPIGSNGDFVAVAGHFNRNRNNFSGSVALRTDTADGRVVPNRFPLTKDERYYDAGRCETATPTPGVADAANSCGSLFDYRYNPSDTGNIRVNSRFTLSDRLTLTLDPYYQYTKANGGGTVVGNEALYFPQEGGPGFSGYVGGAPYAGMDLNGDGDMLDKVRLLAPSQTKTHRLGVIASLRYDINDSNSIRLAYTWDRGKHRQTGEVGRLTVSGDAIDVFPVDDPLIGADGNVLQKRDRLSYAILHQISGEYRGEFGGLTVTAGFRAPFFKRNLNNHCFASSASGFVDCFSGNQAAEDAYAKAHPGYGRPQQRIFKYNRFLPQAGLVYELTPQASLFANYSKGIQVPGTDNLYQIFWYPKGTGSVEPNPETTDNFDLGGRFRSGNMQAQASVWYTSYKNRLAQSYDIVNSISIYRNLGKVEKYGVDASISYAFMPELQVYAFGSYLKSKIKDDVVLSVDDDGNPVYGETAGKREAGAPTYTFGGRIQARLGPLELGGQVKRTGPRYVNDQNLPIMSGGVAVFAARTPSYTLVDLDARLPLGIIGLNDQSYFQFNVTNLFDKRYYGGFDGKTETTTGQFVQIGAPRAVSGTINFAF